VQAGTTVYANTFVLYDTTSGYIVNATAVANRRFLGVVKATVTAPTIDTAVDVYIDGEWDFAATSIAATSHGAPMYVVDNETFDETQAQSICCGVLRQWVSNTRGWVDISVAAQLTANSTNITFADGGAYTHVAALTAVQVDAALEELNLEIDTHIISDGAAGTQDPGTNAEHCAQAVIGWGTGIGYQVLDSGAGIAAESVSAPNGFTTPLPDVIQSVGTTGAPPAQFYHPAAIGAGAQGVGFKVFTDSAMTFNTAAGAAQDPVYRSATGTLTLTKPVAANQTQIVGRVLVADATGECQLDLTEGFNVRNHTHEDESEGGEIYATVELRELVAFMKDGAAHNVTTQDFAPLQNSTIVACFASLTTACNHADTVVLTLNAAPACVIANGARVGESVALAIDVAANADFVLGATANAADAAAGLSITVVFRRNT